MPLRTPSRKQPEPSRGTSWIGLAGLATILILAVVAIGYFMINKRAPAPAEPAAATPTAPQPFVPKHIYSETADPNADIAAGLARAKSEHKRVIVDFGGDWCGDCQVLDIYFHQPANEKLLAKNYVLVHVWIGHIDTNLDVPEKYGVAIHKGVPALAVLKPDGKVVYAQQGQFSDMRHMESSSVTEFLEKWKS
jgi:thiol:disulfide interchange protein